MQLRATKIPDCYEIFPNILKDQRGLLVKTFFEPLFKQEGLETIYSEQFYSVSKKNVIRGLHFQKPPKDQTKLIYCLSGKVFDAVVDLRIGSPTYGEYETFNLCSEKGNMIYIPSGLAHGFFALSEQAIVVYHASNVFSQAHDAGICWNSLPIPWPNTSPLLSVKDALLPNFSEFKSPFYFS